MNSYRALRDGRSGQQAPRRTAGGNTRSCRKSAGASAASTPPQAIRLQKIGRFVVGREWAGPTPAYGHLTKEARARALQAGEPGPLAQAIAGLDIALWDLVARRAGAPLWRMLGGARSLFDDSGRLTDSTARDQVADLLVALAAHARGLVKGG